MNRFVFFFLAERRHPCPATTVETVELTLPRARVDGPLSPKWKPPAGDLERVREPARLRAERRVAGMLAEGPWRAWVAGRLLRALVGPWID
jgi:hypothetical protein